MRWSARRYLKQGLLIDVVAEVAKPILVLWRRDVSAVDNVEQASRQMMLSLCIEAEESRRRRLELRALKSVDPSLAQNMKVAQTCEAFPI